MPEFAGVSLRRMQALHEGAEPLWIAALGVHFVVLGHLLIPVLIHLVGRGGQAERVEWAIYISLLIGYVPLVLIVARVPPEGLSRWVSSWLRSAIMAAALVELAVYAFRANWLFLLSAAAAAAVTIFALRYTTSPPTGTETARGSAPLGVVPLLLAGAFGWMCAGGLVSWGDAVRWLVGAPRTAITLAASTALAVSALLGSYEKTIRPRRWARWWDYVAVAVLVAFSFRTFPMVEFYHWGFYVGPIEQLRQGGRLLWDTPSQYGFLSILIPTVLPGSAWISFWFCQSVMFAVVAAVMYFAFRRLGTRWTNALFAFAITFTTLFFRPRDQSLILPAQMTPSGGPVRFLWCFVLLAFIAGPYFRQAEKRNSRRFAIGGTLIWLASILWSAEGAIYSSAIWFSAYAVFLAQQILEARQHGATGADLWRRLARSGALSVTALASLIVLVAVVYRLFAGIVPDWRGYLEYALLYSRGSFGALPADPSGSIWYLLLLFVVISTIFGMCLSSDSRDSRLVVLAGAWGGAWSIGSYFVGRSHPVNALSLTPLLLFSVVIAVALFSPDKATQWYRVVVVALVPAFAFPITLTLGHAGFPAALTERQLPIVRFTEQLPKMEPTLYTLLRQAGARPADSFVRVADGRLMLPAWPLTDALGPVLSERSWLPKPYEMIGSLSPGRRQVYIDRNAARMPVDGWLIHSKQDTIRGYPALLAQIERTRHEERRFENNQWSVSWMVTRAGASTTSSMIPGAPSAQRLRTNSR